MCDMSSDGTIIGVLNENTRMESLMDRGYSMDKRTKSSVVYVKVVVDLSMSRLMFTQLKLSCRKEIF